MRKRMGSECSEDKYAQKKQKVEQLFNLMELGQLALISDNTKNTMPLTPKDLQDALLSMLNLPKGNTRPSWCDLIKTKDITNISLNIIEDIGQKDLCHAKKWDVIPYSSSLSNYAVEVKLLVDRTVTTLEELMVLPGGYQETVEETPEVADNSQNRPVTIEQLKKEAKFDNFDRTTLVLSANELFVHKYPLLYKGSIWEDNSEFKMSRSFYYKLHRYSPMFAVDCEMCLTERGENELTRVSIVNENYEVLYSTLVRPMHKITNYITAYSGITKQMLKGVKTTINDVQNAIAALIPPDAILIGHSLNSDLEALKLSHPYCIDTSLIYNTSGLLRARPSLKLMAKLVLQLDIQTISKHGHDPTEDAVTAMLLAKYKLSKYPTFCNKFHGDSMNHITQDIEDTKKVLLLEKRNKNKVVVRSTPPKSILDMLQMKGLPFTILTRRALFEKCRVYNSFANKESMVLEDTSKAAYRKLKSKLQSKGFIYSHFKFSNKEELAAFDASLYKALMGAQKNSLHLTFFTGSNISVSYNDRSNGVLFIFEKTE